MLKVNTAHNLEYISTEDGFLGIKEKYFNIGEEKVVIVPFGLESSNSFSRGTRVAPMSIIRASHQLEPYDEEHGKETYRDIGIRTLREQTVLPSVDKALHQIEGVVAELLEKGKFPFILGGEHSITAGAIKPFIKKHKDLVVLHFDAHSELKELRTGEDLSESNVLRDIIKQPISKIVSCGVRNISANEVQFYKENRSKIDIHFAKDSRQWNLRKIIDPMRGKNIYLSFGVNAFDVSLMQATGAPEPGGMMWLEVIKIISEAAKAGNIVGADITELAPIKTMPSCDFMVAKLIYKILGYVFK